MKRLIPVLMLAVLVLAGCAAHTHMVGEGAQGTEMMIKRQWYVLDLAPINEVDTRDMAGGATDYTIKTEANFVDVLITVLVPVITTRTVTVTK
jgi:hypothetical protein